MEINKTNCFLTQRIWVYVFTQIQNGAN